MSWPPAAVRCLRMKSCASRNWFAAVTRAHTSVRYWPVSISFTRRSGGFGSSAAPSSSGSLRRTRRDPVLGHRTSASTRNRTRRAINEPERHGGSWRPGRRTWPSCTMRRASSGSAIRLGRFDTSSGRNACNHQSGLGNELWERFGTLAHDNHDEGSLVGQRRNKLSSTLKQLTSSPRAGSSSGTCSLNSPRRRCWPETRRVRGRTQSAS